MRSLSPRVPAALMAACLLAGGCTYLLGRRIKAVSNDSGSQLLRYVTPAKLFEPGQVIEASDLAWTQWPAASPVQGAITGMSKLVGRVVLATVDPGQPLLERELAEDGAGGGLSSGIPKGMRAVALRSDEVAGVAGFLAPGSRVDVLVTYHSERLAEPVTATVLANAKVLAAGQQIKPDPAGKPVTATVVTLLLNPMEAERAVLASAQGSVHFVLRNAMDTEDSRSVPVYLSSLSGASELSDNDPSPARLGFHLTGGISDAKETLSAHPARVETIYGDSDTVGTARASGLQP